MSQQQREGRHRNARRERDMLLGRTDTRPALPEPGTATALATGAAGLRESPAPAQVPLPEHRDPGQPDKQGDGAAHQGASHRDAASQQADAPHGHEEAIPKDLTRPRTFWIITVLVGLVVLLGVLFVVGLLPRLTQNKALNADAGQADDAPVVRVQHPQHAEADTTLILPGNVRAWQDTGIFARITGYVKIWYHDLGDNVKTGDVLALIDAPDVDQQLEQSKAQLAQSRASLIKAQADLVYNQLQLQRFQDLRKINAVSQMQLDQQVDATQSAQSTVEVTKANIAQFEANVRQFTEEQSWERVVAPFDGKITARSVDIGQLIMPGTTATNTGGGHEMFHMAQTDPLRVMVDVPQTFVTYMNVGERAGVYFRDDRSHAVLGSVTRFAGALDPATRTLLTEVDIPNVNSMFTPGMYLNVQFTVRRNAPPLMVPESALVFNADGTRVGVVRQEKGKSIVHFQPITIGRDTGAELEVQSGIGPDDLIVVNPGERMVDGGPVKIDSVVTPSRPKGPGELGTPGAQPLHFVEPSTQPAGTQPATDK